MDVLDQLRREVHRPVPVTGFQPFETVGETVHLVHPVVVVQAEHDGTDDIVDARAETAAGDDAAGHPGRVEIEAFARTRGLEPGRFLAGIQVGADRVQVAVQEDVRPVVDKPRALHGRGIGAFPETIDEEVTCLFHRVFSLLCGAAAEPEGAGRSSPGRRTIAGRVADFFRSRSRKRTRQGFSGSLAVCRS